MALSMRMAWEHYYHYLAATKASTTVDAYRWLLWAWFGFLGSKRWQRATKRDLQRFISRPPRSGRANGYHLAPNTQLSYAAPICRFYQWAFENGYIRRNPMAGFVLPKGGQPQARSFSQEQLRSIITLAELLDDRLYVMVALGYGAGLRCAEIAGLRIEDIHERRARSDEDDDEAEPEPSYWIEVVGKGGKIRQVPLYPEVHAAIRRHLAARGHPRVGPVVESRTEPGKGMTAGSVSRALSDHIRRIPDPDRPGERDPSTGELVKIPGSGHGLRHSFAQELIEVGGEAKALTISRTLGHADPRLLFRVYLLGYKTDAAELVAKLPFPTRQRRT